MYEKEINFPFSFLMYLNLKHYVLAHMTHMILYMLHTLQLTEINLKIQFWVESRSV